MERKTFYLDHAESLSKGISALKRRNYIFITGEVVTFLVAVGFVVLYTVISDGLWTLFLAAAMLVAYFIIRKLDVSIGSQKYM